jgi:hypothetical protein
VSNSVLVARGVVAILSLAVLAVFWANLSFVAGSLYMFGIFAAVPLAVILVPAVCGLVWGGSAIVRRIVESV